MTPTAKVVRTEERWNTYSVDVEITFVGRWKGVSWIEFRAEEILRVGLTRGHRT